MSTETSVNESVLTGRCYTKARRHPGVVGRWPVPGGGKIPGGPYTLPQLAMMLPAMAACFGLLFLTRGIWGVFGLGNYAVLIALPAVVGFVASRVYVDGRSPLLVVASLVGLATRPRSGRQGGRPVKTGGRARPLAGVCTLHLAGGLATAPATRAVRTAPVAAVKTAAAPVTGGREQARVASGAAALLTRAGEGRSS